MHSRGSLCALLPHAGEMCLIESVGAYDSDSISCETRTHVSLANPLRYKDRLNTICGVEYAAQAMALHAALLCQPSAAAKIGFLAGLREVALHVARLDVADTILNIRVSKLIADKGRSIYEFMLTLNDQPALSGRAAVIIPDNADSPIAPR